MSIGYACLTIGVQNAGLSRCTLKYATEENIRKITLANLSALETIIDYNIQNGIKLFRISSDIIPFGSHPMNQLRWWEEEKDILQEMGGKITKAGMRVSMHPGQYTVLNAQDQNVVKKAVEELIYHDRFLSALGMDMQSKLVLHIGGVYGDKEAAMKTFINNFYLLPEAVKDRLIIENDDKNYNIQEVLSISKEIEIPVVFDNLHHRLNHPEGDLSEFEWIEKCEKTWKPSDGKQKIHYSQQKEGGASGSHSETIFSIPFIEFYKKLPNQNIDIMLEVKDKNLSAVKCINTAVLDTKAKKLEEEWARYKYFVLSRSAKLYNEIRQLLKQKEATVSMEFYNMIEQALILTEDKGAQVNAAQHIWGYFSKNCTVSEKKRYEKLMKAYEEGTGAMKAVKNHLLKCAQSREMEYLINSFYFYL